jgi:hypothetical protein
MYILTARVLKANHAVKYVKSTVCVMCRWQWRSQTLIFGWAKRTAKALDRLGGFGGMNPRKNFEI